jgi:hypothetical protein
MSNIRLAAVFGVAQLWVQIVLAIVTNSFDWVEIIGVSFGNFLILLILWSLEPQKKDKNESN